MRSRGLLASMAFVAAVVSVVIAVQDTPVEADDTVGMVNPITGEWQINHGGFLDRFYFGNPGDFPVFGDWDCDGIDTPGMYRQSDGYVYLRNSNSQGIADIRFFFGDPSDIPLAGDWNGDGCDSLSIYRPSEQRFYIINRLGVNNGGLGPADFSFVFGNPGDKPFAGDFDGDGISEVGLHRESTGFVYYRNSLTTGVADNQFFFGDPDDRLVAGDWNLNGTDSPALFRPYPGGDWQSPGKYYFRFSNTQGNADLEFCATFGWPEGLPIAGDIGKDGPAGNFEDCAWNPNIPTTTTTTQVTTTTTTSLPGNELPDNWFRLTVDGVPYLCYDDPWDFNQHYDCVRDTGQDPPTLFWTPDLYCSEQFFSITCSELWYPDVLDDYELVTYYGSTYICDDAFSSYADWGDYDCERYSGGAPPYSIYPDLYCTLDFGWTCNEEYYPSEMDNRYFTYIEYQEHVCEYTFQGSECWRYYGGHPEAAIGYLPDYYCNSYGCNPNGYP